MADQRTKDTSKKNQLYLVHARRRGQKKAPFQTFICTSSIKAILCSESVQDGLADRFGPVLKAIAARTTKVCLNESTPAEIASFIEANGLKPPDTTRDIQFDIEVFRKPLKQSMFSEAVEWHPLGTDGDYVHDLYDEKQTKWSIKWTPESIRLVMGLLDKKKPTPVRDILPFVNVACETEIVVTDLSAEDVRRLTYDSMQTLFT